MMNLASNPFNTSSKKQRFIKRIKHGLSSGYHRIKKKNLNNYCNQSTRSLPTPSTTPSVQSVLPLIHQVNPCQLIAVNLLNTL